MYWKNLNFILLVSVLLATAETRNALPQVRYREVDGMDQYEQIRHIKSQFTSKRIKDSDQKVLISNGVNDRVLIDWALSLKNTDHRQDGLNVSQECGRQLGQFSSNLNEALSNLTSPLDLFDEKNWSIKGNRLFCQTIVKHLDLKCSIKVIDSFGKIPSGILVAGFNFLGDYSECVGIVNNDWQGKYCYIENGFKNPLGVTTASLVNYRPRLELYCESSSFRRQP